MLEGQHDAAVLRDNAGADEGAVLQATGQGLGLAPGLAVVIAVDEPGVPVRGPVLRVRGEVERGAVALNEDLSGTLADGVSFAGEADIESLQRGPGLALVGAAGDAGVVQRRGFCVTTGENEEHP